MKNNKCEICGKYNGKMFKSDVFGKVCLCEALKTMKLVTLYWLESSLITAPFFLLFAIAYIFSQF